MDAVRVSFLKILFVVCTSSRHVLLSEWSPPPPQHQKKRKRYGYLFFRGGGGGHPPPPLEGVVVLGCIGFRLRFAGFSRRYPMLVHLKPETLKP